MLLFIFARKYLPLKLEPLKNGPFKGPTLHAEVCACFKKRDNCQNLDCMDVLDV